MFDIHGKSFSLHSPNYSCALTFTFQVKDTVSFIASFFYISIVQLKLRICKQSFIVIFMQYGCKCVICLIPHFTCHLSTFKGFSMIFTLIRWDFELKKRFYVSSGFRMRYFRISLCSRCKKHTFMNQKTTKFYELAPCFLELTHFFKILIISLLALLISQNPFLAI